MAALDFPANPTNGQTYDNYQYDSSVGVWRSAGTKNALSSRLTSVEARTTQLETFDATFNSTWTSYTPTFGNFTLGNGVMNARYTQIGKTVIATGAVLWGSTTSLTGLWDMYLPVTAPINRSLFATRVGNAFYTNATPNALYFGDLLQINGDWNALSLVRFGLHNSSGTYATHSDVGPTTPFTFASGFRVNWQIIYEAA